MNDNFNRGFIEGWAFAAFITLIIWVISQYV